MSIFIFFTENALFRTKHIYTKDSFYFNYNIDIIESFHPV